jgi:hypothetical protein
MLILQSGMGSLAHVPEKSLPPNAKTFDHTLIAAKIFALEII